MKKKFTPYTQKKRELFNKSFKNKEKSSKLNLIISLLTLATTSFVGINTYNFNNLNSYPAFEFSVSDDENTTNGKIYSINRSKGEMNNVNFSILEVISGTGFFEGKPFYLSQSIHFLPDEESENNFQTSYPFDFDTTKIKNNLSELINNSDIIMHISTIHISRYYSLKYMNFEHEFKEEFYSINRKGVGSIVDSPYPNYENIATELKVTGGFSISYYNDNKKITDEKTIANIIFEQIENSISRYNDRSQSPEY